jgi:hypothetical protein
VKSVIKKRPPFQGRSFQNFCRGKLWTAFRQGLDGFLSDFGLWWFFGSGLVLLSDFGPAICGMGFLKDWFFFWLGFSLDFGSLSVFIESFESLWSFVGYCNPFDRTKMHQDNLD